MTPTTVFPITDVIVGTADAGLFLEAMWLAAELAYLALILATGLVWPFLRLLTVLVFDAVLGGHKYLCCYPRFQTAADGEVTALRFWPQQSFGTLHWPWQNPGSTRVRRGLCMAWWIVGNPIGTAFAAVSRLNIRLLPWHRTALPWKDVAEQQAANLVPTGLTIRYLPLQRAVEVTMDWWEHMPDGRASHFNRQKVTLVNGVREPFHPNTAYRLQFEFRG